MSFVSLILLLFISTLALVHVHASTYCSTRAPVLEKIALHLWHLSKKNMYFGMNCDFKENPGANHGATRFNRPWSAEINSHGFSSSMEGVSSQQQITPRNKAFCRRSWTLRLSDCFLSRRATINSLSPPLSLSFHLIYSPPWSPPLPAFFFIYLLPFSILVLCSSAALHFL